ncbi:MAG TPA: PAS domain-containing sensor histidine kinase, partial [Methanomassiliicoccales archaeon]|nr:PAS domain-containing sensor histidine kinase [Methanomassiliicoccales archaeon]
AENDFLGRDLVGLLAKGPKIELETMLRRKDGSTLLASVTLSLLTDGGGGPIGVLAVIRDVTQGRAIEKAFLMASQKMSLVSRITRHDLRNQVTVLSGNLELAARAAPDTAVARHIAKSISAANNISELIEFTKEYESLGTKEARWVSAEDLCRQGISTVDLGDIDLNVMVRDLELYADPMLEKVFHNLADNSVRHGGKVRTIDISYRQSGNGISLVYSDDGVGIPQNMKGQVLSEDSSRHGMRLVREILRINDMDIEEVGRHREGVRFEISIPAGRYRIRDSSF